MPVRSDHRLWVRKLDGDEHVVADQPQLRLYPANLAELDECVRMGLNPPLGVIPQARACGSHWCISEASVTAGYMIETAVPVHEDDDDQSQPRLNGVLREVVPGCLSAEAWRFFSHQAVAAFNPAIAPAQELYLYHVQTGMRLYELYALLDQDDAVRKGSLAEAIAQRRAANDATADYAGPWALETMGGAGGQTVGGVIATATHGGDVNLSAIGEAVVALHLIGADGRHHWIERTQLRPTSLPMQLVDEARLRDLYRGIEVHRDDNLLNAAVVACGRMGVVYSVVLRVMRPYALHEHRGLLMWEDVSKWVADITHPLHAALFKPSNHFVKIDVNPYGSFWEPSEHHCYLVTRELHALDWAGTPDPLGRQERGGANAGNVAPLGTGNGWFANPCGSDNWIRTGLLRMRDDFSDIRNKAIAVWLVCAAVIAFPLTPLPVRLAAMTAQDGAAATILAMQVLIGAIAAVVLAIGPHSITFGDTLAAAANACAHLGLFPILRGIYEVVAFEVHLFDPNHPSTPAIWYAAMDEHDYLNVGCSAPGDSIEFFVDADSAQLPQFIDHVLHRIRDLENGVLGGAPQAFGGYISLRFMAGSAAPLAMQRWPHTCSIEIAGLSAVHGTDPLLRTLEEDARAWNIVLHWGQRNNWDMAQIESRFDAKPGGALFRWRQALADLTEHGRRAQFSTPFSRFKGLEVTDPLVGSFAVTPDTACAGESVTVDWDALANPPETTAMLVHRHADGSATNIALPGLAGSIAVPAGPGQSTLTLALERPLNGRRYTASSALPLRGFAAGDTFVFTFAATPMLIDGVTRQAVLITLFSQFISNTLRVTQVASTFAGTPAWRLRHQGLADIAFTTAASTQPVPGLPVFNTEWLLFAEPPALPGPAPTVTLTFTLQC